MPIEFYCPGCGNLMRTPDETAGRKGRCPTCQLKVQIPASSVTSSSSMSAVPRTAAAATPAQETPQPIRFECGSCGKTLSVAAANAGKKGQCPHCGDLMSIPLKSPPAENRWKGTPKQRSENSPTQRMKASPSTSAPAQPAARDATPQAGLTKAGGEKIEFHCSSCHELVRVGAAAAGKRGQCPRCKAVIQIPQKSASVPGLQPIPSAKPTTPPVPGRTPPPNNAPPASGLTPLPNKAPPASGLTPLPNKAPPASGLTPLPNNVPSSSGLTPLPNNAPASSGLTPLDDLDALSPLEPLGLTSLGPTTPSSDPFGGDPFGPGASNLRPLPAAATPAARRRPRTGERSGPEIATMICGGCLIFYASAQIVFVTLTLLFRGVAILAMFEEWQEMEEGQAVAGGIFVLGILLTALGGAAMLTILAGGIQMIRMKVWGLCLAACILAMLPCTFNCICLFGFPFGVWGIIMLSLDSVRSGFR